MVNSSNLYRKARALVAKATEPGYSAPAAAAALSAAASIVAENHLERTRISWPPLPDGYCWSGVVGMSNVVERTQTAQAQHLSRGERLMLLLDRSGGASADELAEALGVKPHSLRALISVEARQKRGLDVRLNRQSGRYSIVA
ncbi:MAG: DUF3489 domain-containing protein [Aliihoeflea sp.]